MPGAQSRNDERDEARVEAEIRERHTLLFVRPDAAQPEDRVEHRVVVLAP